VGKGHVKAPRRLREAGSEGRPLHRAQSRSSSSPQQRPPPHSTPKYAQYVQCCDSDALKGPDHLCPAHLCMMLFNIEDWDRNRDEEENRDEISND